MIDIKIVSDLMDAYAQRMNLLLSLVSESGEAIYSSHSNKQICKEQQKYGELVQTAKLLHQPTITTVEDYVLKQELFYFISPMTVMEGQKVFVTAGPFLKHDECRELKYNDDIDVIENNAISMLLRKFCNLYELIYNKQSIESNYSNSTEWLSVLHNMSQQKFTHLSNEKIYEDFLEQIIGIQTVDFVAIATRNEQDVFEVNITKGDSINEIARETFYLGEGILGNALLYQKRFFWDINTQSSRIEFFQRHRIFPQQLFGIPIKGFDNGDLLVFGGSYLSGSIKSVDIDLLSDTLQIIINKISMMNELRKLNHYKYMYINWLEFIESYTQDEMEALPEHVITLIESLELGIEWIATARNGDTFWRNKPIYSHIIIHNDAQKKSDVLPFSYKKNENYIHINLDFYGFFTIKFSESFLANEDQLWRKSVTSMLTILKKKFEENNTSKFKVLYEALKELSEEKYQKATLALSLVHELEDKLPLNNLELTLLKNCCIILPYSMPYLKTIVGSSDAYKILERLYESTEQVNDCLSLMVAYINNKIIQQHQLKAILNYSDQDLQSLNIQFRNCEEGSITQSMLEATSFAKEKNEVIEALPITKREKEIFSLLIEGYNNVEIASELQISSHTVKNHVTNIFKKIDVTDRVQAMALFYRM